MSHIAYEQNKINRHNRQLKFLDFLSLLLSLSFRNEDRDDRNRKASYDIKEGTSDCEDWSAQITAHEWLIVYKLLLVCFFFLNCEVRCSYSLCSPKPTLEDVHSWGQSFDKLMCCPAGRNSFRQFLRTEFSEENMLFWLACEEFSKETNKSVVEEKARVIYEDYISILSPKEVGQVSFFCFCLFQAANFMF